jgi:hypothetical protein
MLALVPLLECEKEIVANERGSAVVKSFMTPSIIIFFCVDEILLLWGIFLIVSILAMIESNLM